MDSYGWAVYAWCALGPGLSFALGFWQGRKSMERELTNWLRANHGRVP